MITGTASRLAGMVVLVLAAQACEKKAPDTAAMTDTTMTATTPPAPATMAPPAELKAQSDAMIAAWNQKDPAKPAAFFTADATVHADTATYTGAADISKRWIKPGLPMLSDLAVSDQSFTGSGDMMTETGKYTEKMTEPKKAAVNVAGTYTATWTRVGADWKVKDLTVHSDMPMAAPKPN